MKEVFRCLSFVFILPLSAFGQLEFGPRIKLTDPISGLEASRIVDMDGDGDIDAAVIKLSIELDWFENDGDGNFEKHNWKPEKFLNQSIIGIADHNGDGRQDIWLEEYEEGVEYKCRYRYFVAKGQEGGGFCSAIPVAVTPDFSENGSASLVADLNGDGNFDILGNGFVFLGTQERNFLPPTPIPPDIDFDSSEVAIHDYDEDGDLDLFIRHNQQILYCKNTGSGQFADPTILVELSADHDMDGFAFVHQDIIGAPPLLVVHVSMRETNEDRLFLHERQDDGTTLRVEEFTLPKVEGQDYWDWEFARSEPLSTRTYLSQIGGQLSSGNDASRLYELKCGEPGLSVRFLRTHQDFTTYDFTSEADLNGDGFRDLVVMIPSIGGVVGSASDHILWYPGTVDGSFQETPETVAPAAYERLLMIADDLEGDGDTDLVFGLKSALDPSRDESRMAVWTNHGNGTDFEKRTFTIPGSNPHVLGIDDFVTIPVEDDDPPSGLPFDLPQGRKDFIIHSNFDQSLWPEIRPSEVNLVLQSSAGDFHVKLVETVDPGSIIYYVDWDGDGARDLVFYGEDGALSWSKRTDYKFGPRRLIMNFPTHLVYMPRGANFALLDMDRDGDLDVYGRGSLFGPDSTYWVERGAESTILSIRRLNTPLDLIDFDADGDGIRESTALFGNSGGSNPNVDYRFENTDPDSFNGGHWGLFDFDADGDLDLLLSAPTFGTNGAQRLIWHENQGGGPSFKDVTSVEIAGVEVSYRDQFAFKDMDGDGTRDLLVVSLDSALVEWFKITSRRGPQAFDDWMAGQNLTGSSAGPGSDWDMDRRTNWEEFIYGTQASMHDSGYGREPHIETTSGGFHFTYTRRKSGGGLNLDYGMQRSRTLNGDWEPWNPEMPPPTSSGDYEHIRIPITPGEDAEFFRVKLPEIPE